ncbi:protein of unknown function [Tistlia consotensis]|uniref:Uncharacterized protein n=1 Tax=Tistlia consotensis USBA 355 TaxID=560819 RepID=A0A1Y6C8Y6_9PROT|nr:ImmA/IrrE family metallo-endopeptidase [Tistlia consotensis]SMF52049.1 protein of unknown function [Tistlia consotensis USBA 355]SNR83421.1 protein of unknown function [Tistlia consotensis]
MDFRGAFASQRTDFYLRFVEPLRVRLEKANLREWIELQADRLAVFGRVGKSIHFGQAYLEALSADVTTIAWEQARAQGRSFGWTADVTLESERANVSQLMLASNKDQRAVLAHELAHTILWKDRTFSRWHEENLLTQDPGIERLADDLARALVLPRSLLADVGLPTLEDLVSGSGPSLLKIIWDSAVPTRLGLTRIVSSLCAGRCLIFCLCVRKPGADLFSRQPSEHMIFAKWIVDIAPVFDQSGDADYVFCDAVALSVALRPKPSCEFSAGSVIERHTLDVIFTKNAQGYLKGFLGAKVMAVDGSDVEENIYLVSLA